MKVDIDYELFGSEIDNSTLKKRLDWNLVSSEKQCMKMFVVNSESLICIGKTLGTSA